MSVLLNKGAGNFRPPVSYPAGFGVLKSSLDDFNGDNLIDLVVSNAGSNAVSLLPGKADGTFGSPISAPTGGYPMGIATGDFNGDGKLDLASANEADSSVSVFDPGQRKWRVLKTDVDYAVDFNPTWMISADLNMDGNLDLVTANAGGNSVSVLLGNGDGTFQPAVTYPVTSGANPYVVAAGDFNHDGKLDLAVANAYTNNVSILIGNGDGTFQPHVDYPTGLFPYAVEVGDFNADGALDLAVSNSECPVPTSNCPGTVSILLVPATARSNNKWIIPSVSIRWASQRPTSTAMVGAISPSPMRIPTLSPDRSISRSSGSFPTRWTLARRMSALRAAL